MQQKTFAKWLIVGATFGPLLASSLFFYYGIYFPYKSSSASEQFFIVGQGQNLLIIADNLEKEGLVRSKFFFIFYVLLQQNQNKLQAGRYLLNPAMSVKDVAQKIIKGEVVKNKIQIIEGWSLKDIGRYLEGEGLFREEELFKITGFPLVDYSKNNNLPKPKDFTKEFDFLTDKPTNVSLEGYLFPDTYQIDESSSPEDTARITLNNFNKKFTKKFRQESINQKKTIFEIITMASLLEKEAKTYQDKQIVSSILWKRLESGIPLQVDATINYITGEKSTKISTEKIKIDSPYNTYKYRGLPLGPIANPGLESISAALHPQNTAYWYYLSTPEGKIIFSKTLKEHNVAKAKYLK